MNVDLITDALNLLDDDLIAETGKRRERRLIEMKKKRVRTIALIAAAVMALGGTSVYAVQNGGFFRDKQSITGAVTGETYENATGELTVTASCTGGILNVSVAAIDSTKAPYAFFDKLAIGEYKIVTKNGDVKEEQNDVSGVKWEKGNAVFDIDVSALESGAYRIEINRFVGSAKANQPLDINGDWSAVFTVD